MIYQSMETLLCRRIYSVSFRKDLQGYLSMIPLESITNTSTAVEKSAGNDQNSIQQDQSH